MSGCFNCFTFLCQSESFYAKILFYVPYRLIRMHRVTRLSRRLFRLSAVAQTRATCAANKDVLLSKHHSKFATKYTQHVRWLNTTCVRSGLVQFKLADIGEGIKEAEVLEWFVEEGEKVSQFQDICEVQSDKSTAKITSRYDGVIMKRYYDVGENAQVGTTLVDIEVEGEEDGTEATQDETSDVPTTIEPPTPTKTPQTQGVLATPAVRRLAKEHGVDLNDIEGSGKDGRVVKEDILEFIEQPEATVTSSSPTMMSSMPTVMSQDKTEKLKGIRKAMVRSMKASLDIPHFGYDDEYDMNELVLLRKKIKKEVKHNTGVKLSYMPFIMKATSAALAQYPILNSQLDSGHENIIYKADHNIGVAVDTPHGLLLPSVKSVQNLSIIEIAVELNRLHEAGLNNKLTQQDVAGGTFSLSNIGSIGGTYIRGVPPQVAIGLKIQVLIKQHGDLIMTVTYQVSHNVIDDTTMARFSNLLKDYLENPSKLLLYLK
ncbi:LOW QUALITY PROTEIN: lipoamide acyltransferase component of branched-chain alpha-keto acid dehydrogenase complex, mitochondrial [Ciona intestinalis]